MRSITNKTDNVGDTLAAADFNANFIAELQEIATSSGFTLDPAGGPDVDLKMLAKALAFYANAGATYQDGGAVNAYALTLSTTLQGVDSYKDGLRVTFKTANPNTGASTVNVNAIGVKAITLPDGTALSGGEIEEYSTLVYSLSNDRFELVGESKGRNALVYRSADLTLSSAVPDEIPFNSESYDTSGFHDNVTNPERITIPSGVSKVRLAALVTFEGINTTGVRTARIIKNGDSSDPTYIGEAIESEQNPTASDTYVNLSTPILEVSPGDYFTVWAQQTSGVDLDVLTGSPAGQRTWFNVEAVK